MQRMCALASSSRARPHAAHPPAAPPHTPRHHRCTTSSEHLHSSCASSSCSIFLSSATSGVTVSEHTCGRCSKARETGGGWTRGGRRPPSSGRRNGARGGSRAVGVGRALSSTRGADVAVRGEEVGAVRDLGVLLRLQVLDVEPLKRTGAGEGGAVVRVHAVRRVHGQRAQGGKAPYRRGCGGSRVHAVARGQRPSSPAARRRRRGGRAGPACRGPSATAWP